jgi:hypothetical protein
MIAQTRLCPMRSIRLCQPARQFVGLHLAGVHEEADDGQAIEYSVTGITFGWLHVPNEESGAFRRGVRDQFDRIMRVTRGVPCRMHLKKQAGLSTGCFL